MDAAPAPSESQTGQLKVRELTKHGLSSLVASGLVQLINVVSGIMLARGLGPVGRGELAAAMLWPTTLVAIGSLGVIDAVPYFASRQSKRAGEIASTGMLLAALQAVAIMGVGYLLMPVTLGHLGGQVVFDGRVYLLWAPLTLLTLVGAEVLRGRLVILAFNAIRVLVVLLSAAGLLILLVMHSVTVTAVLMVYLAANVFTLLLTLALMRAHRIWSFQPRWSLTRGMLAYGLKSHAGNLSMLVNLRADQTLISLLFAPVSLGLYSVALSLTSAVNLVGVSVALVALPAIGSCHSMDEMKGYFVRFVQVVVALSGLAVLMLVLLAPRLITLFFGPAFAPASWPARLLLLGALFMSTNQVLGAGLNAFNKPLVASVAVTLATVVTLIGLAGLLPRFGIAGAAAASALAYSTATAYMLWYSVRRLQIGPRSLVPTGSDIAWLWSRLGRQAPQELVS